MGRKCQWRGCAAAAVLLIRALPRVQHQHTHVHGQMFTHTQAATPVHDPGLSRGLTTQAAGQRRDKFPQVTVILRISTAASDASAAA